MVSTKLFKEKHGSAFYSEYFAAIIFSIFILPIIRNGSFFDPQLQQLYKIYVLFIFIFLCAQILRNTTITLIMLILNALFSIYIAVTMLFVLNVQVNFIGTIFIGLYVFTSFGFVREFLKLIKQCKDPSYVNPFQQLKRKLVWQVVMISSVILIVLVGNIAYEVLIVPSVNEVQYTTGTLEHDDIEHRDEYKYIVDGQAYFVRADTGTMYQSDTANVAYSTKHIGWFAVVENDLSAWKRIDLAVHSNVLIAMGFIVGIYFMSNQKKIVEVEKEEQVS